MAIDLIGARRLYRNFGHYVAQKEELLTRTGLAVMNGVRGLEKYFFDKYLIAPGRTLDLGCGAGRLFPYLKSRAQVIHGVDQCFSLIRLARRQNNALVFQTSLDHLPPQVVRGQYDNLLCVGNVLGGIFTEAEQNAFVAALSGLSRPGMRFFIDVFFPPPAHLFEERFHLFGAGNTTLRRGSGGVLMLCGEQIAQYYPSGFEIEYIARKAGFDTLLEVDTGRLPGGAEAALFGFERRG